MALPTTEFVEVSDIEFNADEIVPAIGREAVDVYLFLSKEYAKGPVANNFVFQFIYRSFYRLDNAGLGLEIKTKYFALMDELRGTNPVDLAEPARKLFTLVNHKGQHTLQFSFLTKLANTVNKDYPIYDAEVARVFRFRAPYHYKSFEIRLQEYLTFYERLRNNYANIIKNNQLVKARRLFREIYSTSPQAIPDIKVLDFIFWSAGKLSVEADQ